jgi:hypothetical protein
MNDYIVNIPIEKLKEHPINSEIYVYDKKQQDELKKSISLNGLLEPIVIDKRNMIVSGHRRFHCIKELGWEEVNCRLSYFENDKVALIELNRYRKKTSKEILKESEILTEEYKTLIKRGSPKKRERRQSKNWSILNVSDKLGVSMTKLKQLKSIQKYEPSLLDEIDLGKISVNVAYSLVRKKYILNGDDDKTSQIQKFKSVFNRSLKDYSPSKELILEILNSQSEYKDSFLLK